MSEQSFESELEKLRSESLYRRLVPRSDSGGILEADDEKVINFSSNDYLDLANHPRVKEKAIELIEEFGTGATASRLVTGTLECHQQLEQRLAGVKDYPEALVFGSGYLTNTGVIPALLEGQDFIAVDRLAHASLIDGLLQSQARFNRFRHNDLAHLEQCLEQAKPEARKLVVTESLFSMDGDRAPLRQICELAAEHGALVLVDEAHATGVFGSGGSGLVAEQGLTDEVDISMSTFSKALGSYGGAVACRRELKEIFINKARSFIYSTGLPPAAVGAVLGALDLLEESPELGTELLDRARFFRQQLQQRGLDTGDSESQIIPVLVGDNQLTLEFADRLETENILAVAIRPPTVPAGSARVRLSVTLAHSRQQLDRAAATIGDVAEAVGVV